MQYSLVVTEALYFEELVTKIARFIHIVVHFYIKYLYVVFIF